MTTEPTPDLRTAAQAVVGHVMGQTVDPALVPHTLVMDLMRSLAATPSEPDGAQGEGREGHDSPLHAMYGWHPACGECAASVAQDSPDPLRELEERLESIPRWVAGMEMTRTNSAIYGPRSTPGTATRAASTASRATLTWRRSDAGPCSTRPSWATTRPPAPHRHPRRRPTMPDLDIYPAPGEDVVVHAPAGTTFTKPSINTRKDRIRAHNTGTYVPPQPETPPVEPPPVIVPQPTVRAFPLGGTPAQLVTLAKDLTVDVIEIAAGTYPRWACFLDVVRPSDAKLLIRPKGEVIWDGTGTSNTPPWRIGWTTKASYITLAPFGTGTFTAQNYRLGKAGVVMARYFDHLTFDGLTVKGCYGDKAIDSTLGPQHTHAAYIMGGDGQYWQSNGWTVEGPGGTTPMLNGFQTDGSPNAHHLVVRGWTVRDLWRAVYAWANPTDLVLDGWQITDTKVTIDTPGTAQGVVSNMRSVNSGPMAPGQGSWKGTLLVSGGGNTAS